MRKILSSILAATVAALFLSAPLHAQSSDNYGAIQRLLDGESANATVGAVSTYTPIIVKWVGGSGGGTITVAAGGDLSLSTGAVGGSAADTTVNTAGMGAPCGATPGVLDLSTPAATCNTLGEVVSVINKSPNWRAVLRDSISTDTSDNTLITLSEISGTAADGVALLGDNAVSLVTSAEVSSEPATIQRYIDTTRVAGIAQNPSAGSRVVLFQINTTQTYAGGALSVQVVSCKTLYPSSWTGGIAQGVLTETCTTLDNQPAAASTSAKQISYPWGMESRKNERLLIRTTNTTTASTAVVLNGYGRVAALSR